MRKFLFFLVVICISSCTNSKDPIGRINAELKIDNKGPLRKYLPQGYTDDNSTWNYLRQKRRKSGLPSIENGSETPEIRIWEDRDFGWCVFTISYKDDKWIVKNRLYKPFGNSRSDDDSIVIYTLHLGSPRISWNRFINKLIDKGILRLKDESEISGYYIPSEFLYVGVEVAAKNYYRYYSLPSARENSNKVPEDKAMLGILTFIEKQFPDLVSAYDRYSKMK